MREHFRGVKEWQACGVPLRTSSDVACKMFDATLTQIYGFYDDPTLGGIEGSLDQMEQADPTFFLGQVLSTTLQLGGPFPNRNPVLKTKVQDLKTMLESLPDVTNLEKLHMRATEEWSQGHVRKAQNTYQTILTEYPQDRLALRLIYDIDFNCGDEAHRLDIMKNAVTTINMATDPLSGYIHGMHGFALCEMFEYSNAEKETLKGLNVMHGKDIWAIHALSHVFEMQERNDEGIRLLEKTEKDWLVGGVFDTHLYWHKALYHFDENNLAATLDIYDQEIAPRITPTALISMSDAATLLYRIMMLGGNIGDRWKTLYDTARPFIEKPRHSKLLQDVHLFLICSLTNDKSPVELMKSVLEDFREGDNERYKQHKSLMSSLYAAIEMYTNEEFSGVVDCLYPLMNQVVDIGGSQVQRDVINLMLITAAFYSPRSADNKLARSCLQKRKILKERSPALEHLMDRST